VLCASPSYLSNNGTPQHLDELFDHQCLVYSLVRDSDQWRFQNPEGGLEKVKVRPHLKASSGECLRSAAVEGLGIVQLPSFVVYKEIEEGALVPILRDYQRSNLHAYAIYPQTRHLSQRVRAFVDFLVKRFQGVPYWDQNLQ